MKQEVELTIDESYVDWGLKEGIREIIQNSFDGEQAGFPSQITYDRKAAELSVTNKGARLPRKSLLLGFSTKKSDKTMVGQFGEGYKLGCLAIARLGREMKIYNGEELWSPIIKHSKSFDQKVLCFSIETSDFHDEVTFKIPITPEEWDACRDQFSTYHTTEKAEVEKGEVLFSPHLKGRVFIGGIEVARLKNIFYGYNFRPKELTIDRDRRMVNEEQVSQAATTLWYQLYSKNSENITLIEELLQQERVDDLKMMLWDWTVPKSLSTNLSERFLKKYGQDAYPVNDQQTANEMRDFGKQAVITNRIYGAVLRQVLGSPESVREKAARSVKSVYDTSQLSEIERGNFNNALGLVKRALPVNSRLPFIEIVEFGDGRVKGVHIKEGEMSRIMVSRDALQSLGETVEVMIHEICHEYGEDRSHEHVMEMEKLWKKVFNHVYTRGVHA